MEIHEMIKRLREDQGLSQETLATRVGYKDRSSIAKVEAGVVDLTRSKIEAFAEALGVSPAFLMGYKIATDSSRSMEDADQRPLPSNILPMPKTYKVPLVGTIACGEPILAVEEADELVDVPEWIDADFALRCKGDSMINARIFDGDIVYIKKQEHVETGQIAAVRISDEATLKKVYYAQEDGRITLRACNPLYSDLVYEGETLNEIEILGLAVGFYSKVRHN